VDGVEVGELEGELDGASVMGASVMGASVMGASGTGASVMRGAVASDEQSTQHAKLTTGLLLAHTSGVNAQDPSWIC